MTTDKQNFVGRSVKVMFDNGEIRPATIIDQEWHDELWNPVTQSDGVWVFRIKSLNGDIEYRSHHNLVFSTDN